MWIWFKMRDIETVIKLINAWGFAYRDTIVPPTSNDRLHDC